MTLTLVLLGATCIVAAAIGGGLKVAQVAEIPLIDSRPRQAMLAVVGGALIILGVLLDRGSPPATEVLPGRDDSSESQEEPGTASITLTQSTGPPGTSLRVGGSGFASNEPITIRFHHQQVGDADADADGAFGGETIVVPANWPLDGSFDVIATGQESGIASQAAFVIPPAAVEVSPAQASPGTEVRVAGTGFAVGEDVVVELHLDQLATVPANSKGSFSVSVRVPDSWPFDGEFDIVATGQTSRRTASQALEIA